MKKYLTVFLTIHIAIFSLFSLFFINEFEKYSLFSKDLDTLLIINSDTENKNYLANLKNVADANEIVLTNITMSSNNDMNIFTTDLYLNGKLNSYIHEFGDFKKLSNFEKQKNTGKLNFFDTNTKITVNKFLDKQNNVGTTFQVDFSRSKLGFKEFKKKIEAKSENITVELMTEEPIFWNQNVNLALILLLLLVSFILLLIYYCQYISKNLSILESYGASFLEKNRYLILKIKLVPVVSICIVLLLLFSLILFYFKTSLKYFFIVGGITVVYAVAIFLISCFFSILLVSYLNNIINSIKNKKMYRMLLILNALLVIVTTLSMILTIQQYLINHKELRTQYSTINSWKYTEYYYQTYLKYHGEENVNNERKTSFMLSEFIRNIANEKKDYFIIDTSNYMKINELPNQPYVYEMNEGNSKTTPGGEKITVTLNYFSINKILPTEEIDYIRAEINYDDKVRNILVPLAYKQYEKQIRKSYLDDFYFKKIEVANIYNEKLGENLLETSKNDLSINVIYIPNNLNYLTFNTDIDSKEIKNPVVEIETFNTDISYLNMYISTSFFFKTNKTIPYDEIKMAVPKNTRNIGVMSLYTQNGELIKKIEEKNLKIILFTISIILITVVLMYNWLFLSYQKNRNKIMIKLLNGVSFLKIDIKLFIYFTLMLLVPITLATYINYNSLTIGLIVYFVSVLIKLFISFYFYKKIEVQLKKGGKT